MKATVGADPGGGDPVDLAGHDSESAQERIDVESLQSALEWTGRPSAK